MLGKLILLILVLFCAYWGHEYYKNRKKPDSEPKKNYKRESDIDNPDDLQEFYERKIAEIEAKSVEEIEKAQDTLAHYKERLEKLKNLKNK